MLAATRVYIWCQLHLYLHLVFQMHQKSFSIAIIPFEESDFFRYFEQKMPCTLPPPPQIVVATLISLSIKIVDLLIMISK
jgi:hypothetical protein